MTSAFKSLLPYTVVHDFLDRDLVGALLAWAVSHQAAFVPAGTGRNLVNPSIRSNLRLDDFGPLGPVVRERFHLVAAGQLAAAGLDPSRSQLEIQMAAYGDGCFYRRHIDTEAGELRKRADRVLSGVCYFFAEPKEFSGGSLRLHSILPSEQGGSFIDIDPENGMLVLFPSWMPHEVRPVSLPHGEFKGSRFSINCWFRRPVSGT